MKFDIVPQELYARAIKLTDNITDCICYNYTDEGGKTIGAVTRVEFKDPKGERKKTFIQADYSKQYKRFKVSADILKTSLFNRHNIIKANCVVWCEGEKAALELQSILPEKYAATTGTGGAGNQQNINISPLIGKKVIIWPDNDKMGQHGAIKLNTMLHEKKINVIGWIKIADEWNDKDDAYDIIQRYGKDYTLNLLTELGDPKEINLELPEIMPRDIMPFNVLGYTSEDEVVIYCFQDAVVRAIRKSQFDEKAMITIYNDLPFWYDYCGRSPRSDKPDILTGLSKMWALAQEAGFFNPDITKHGGVYKDGDDYVAHLGDRLYINGVEYDLDQRMDNGIYVADSKADVKHDCPEITQDEADLLREYFSLFRTRLAEHRQVLLGWAIASMLAPILPRRPHIWLYSPANVGKSFISGKMSNLTDLFGIRLDSSSTTAAGVRQYVRGRGCPLFWDEAEAQTRGEEAKWSSVMEMVRISFDSRDGKTVQGSREQVAKFFVPRMMFCFSSVRMADFEETLASRIIPIALNKPSTHEEVLRYYESCRKIEARIDWNNISSRLFKRVYNNAETFFKNYDMAHEMFTEMGTDDRRSSALAVCFAGYALMFGVTPMSKQDMQKKIWKNPYKIMPEEQSDAEYLRTLIMCAAIRFRTDSGDNISIMFQDFIAAANSNDVYLHGVNLAVIAREFRSMGLEYISASGKVYVWAKSPRLYRALGQFDGIASVAPSLEGFERGKNDGFLFDIREEIFYNV